MKQNKKFFFGLALGICIAGTISFLYLSDSIKEKYTAQIEHQQSHIDQQAAMIDSGRQVGMINLMNLVLANVSEELGKTPERYLSDEMVEQIAALSYSFISHMYQEKDGIPADAQSPERGQLLLLLTTMRIDSGSMKKMLAKTSFAGALLREANLEGVNLVGADLQRADLQDANLKEANLNGTNLSFANLWGANLEKAQLIGANLKRADLSWSILNGADLKWGRLLEADLVAAQARNACLRGAFLQWADLTGAFLNEADLANTNMFRANLKKANLKKANLSGSILTYAIMSEANLDGINLVNADLTNLIIADENWLARLDEWQVGGAKDIQQKYQQIEAFSYENSRYQLTTKSN